MPPVMQLDALVPGGPYRAVRRAPIVDIAGAAVGELSLVPRLMVQRCLAALRKSAPLDAKERASALARAGRAFATETVDGVTPGDYQRMVSRVSGLPIAIVRAATQAIAESAVRASDDVECARPTSSVAEWRDPLTRSGRAVWTRRGEVFAVNAAGNHPGVHSLWLQSLSMGYHVAVRPSGREPFTPHRLISSLRRYGFGDDRVALLPTDHTLVDDIVGSADLAMVYGGDDVVRKYKGNPNVLAQGPGRLKVLVTVADWRAHLDTVVTSVAAHGGAACINATAVFVANDPAPLAKAIAERLQAIPSLPPEDDNAQLPVLSLSDAKNVEKVVLTHARGSRAWLGGERIAEPIGDNRAVLRPAVFQVDRPDAPQTRIEMGFPCVWVAPWSPEDGTEPLRDTLVLTAIVEDDALVDRLVGEPSISNVYLGDCPTCWFQSDIPHDRYLAEFLMRTKGVVRR